MTIKISVVTTLYQSSTFIGDFYERMVKSLTSIGVNSYEIIFVDDGSDDDSLDIALKISNDDKSVKVIQLSRNFGHHKAILTGLSYAKGEYVFLIDVDLEEKPELLIKFWEKMHLNNAKGLEIDVVYGVQKQRQGALFEKITSKFFYKIFNSLSHVSIPHNSIIARLMTAQYAIALTRHRDRSVFLGGLAAITGFNQIELVCEKSYKGSTTYNFSRKLSQTLNSLLSFSTRPLELILLMGIMVSIISFFFGFFIFVQALFFSKAVQGWASLIVILSFLSGLTIFSIGAVGMYVAKIFDEVKDRPYTIIKNKWGFD